MNTVQRSIQAMDVVQVKRFGEWVYYYTIRPDDIDASANMVRCHSDVYRVLTPDRLFKVKEQ